MNYPFWHVPFIGSGWVIGIIAIFHVMISQFAVGGGLYLPLAERRAMRMGDKETADAWLRQLARYSKFFLLITGVYGTVSGVGIWFAIGLTNPEATSTLIHNFVFGWAIEWVFFVIELTTIAVYYSTWGRIDPKLHLKVGWVYAASSFCTLVIINGILTFMLTPGNTWLSVAGTGHEASKFWNAFFNPTYWPSLVLRICVCASLAGIWALVSASRIDGASQPALKTSLVKWSVRWLLPSFVATPFIFAWYLLMVPSSQRALLSLGIDTIGSGTFSTLTHIALILIVTSATIILVAYYLAYRNPVVFNTSHAIAILLLALIATGAGEYSRELLRKPYVIGNWMYTNGVRVPNAAKIDQEGYLTHSNWVWNGSDSAYSRGEAIYRGECGACHTLNGYRPLVTLLSGRDRTSIDNFVTMLHEYKADSPYHHFMPPMVGTSQEVEDLVDYLNAQVNKPAASAGNAARAPQIATQTAQR